MDGSSNRLEIDKSIDSPFDGNSEAFLSVRAALTESALLLRLLNFRSSRALVTVETKGTGVNASPDLVQSMLALKKAAEHFQSLVNPATPDQKRVLRDLQLEEVLSVPYWHGLLLPGHKDAQTNVDLDRLCTKLFKASQMPPMIHVGTIKIKESIGDSVATGSADQSRSGLFAAFIAGMSAMLLLVLAVNLFQLTMPEQIRSLTETGSTVYRTLMVLVVLVVSVSVFITLSRLFFANAVSTGVPAVSRPRSAGNFTNFFDLGASNRRIVAGALGPALLGLGLGISISAGFGTFGFSVLLDGINKTFGVPFWVSQTVLTMSFYLIAWLWARVPLGPGTVTTLLLIGPAISFGASLPPNDIAFAGNLLAFVLGLLLFAGGISLAAAAALGPDGVTALSLAAERKQNWPVSKATFLWDITAIATGVVLGGNFGVATVVGLFAVPFLIHLFIPPLRRLLHP